jgi:hypothetical protein
MTFVAFVVASVCLNRIRSKIVPALAAMENLTAAKVMIFAVYAMEMTKVVKTVLVSPMVMRRKTSAGSAMEKILPQLIARRDAMEMVEKLISVGSAAVTP